ncbi:MAG: methyltransferase [Polyangiales bacterium]
MSGARRRDPIMDHDPNDLRDDALAGPFRVWQRKRGHRYSLDDVITGWVAARACPAAGSVVDLGCGLGSVLLMLAYKLPRARLWGVEAQAESFALLERNCERNAVRDRVSTLHADLREPACQERLLCEAALVGHRGFDLVTGTPPYQPEGHGSVSPDPQRAHARVELRGGVEAYLAAAAVLLAPDGTVVICADARTPERVENGAAAAGLATLTRMDVVPAPRKPALFSVFSLAHAAHAAARRCERLPAFFARDERGARTPEALAVRSFFDLPLPLAEAPSPQQRARSQRALRSEAS